MVSKTPAKAKGRENKNKATPLKKTQGGKVVKGQQHGKPPMSKQKKESIKAARMALATGQISTDEQARKHAMDLRTLYVRFKKEMPADEAEVRKRLDDHPEIKFVRIPRQCQKQVRYAFVEFGSEAQCEAAKDTLTKGPNAKDEFYVDFVGVKSKSGGNTKQSKNRAINPNRLFVGGLVEGLDASKLKKLFPKCVSAQVGGKKAGKKPASKCFGFVQFDNPADAKAAFDASQKLTITGKNGSDVHHITVVYAKVSKSTVRDSLAAEQSKSDSKKKKKKKQTSAAAAAADEPAEAKSEQKEEAMEEGEEGSNEASKVESEGSDSGKEEEEEESATAEQEEEEEEEGSDEDVENDDDSDEEQVENDAESDDEGDEEEVENDAESSDEEDKS